MAVIIFQLSLCVFGKLSVSNLSPNDDVVRLQFSLAFWRYYAQNHTLVFLSWSRASIVSKLYLI